MTLDDNAYAAFLLDYASGALSPAERLAGDLHRTLSRQGAQSARLVDALGGSMLEQAAGRPTSGRPDPGRPAPGRPTSERPDNLPQPELDARARARASSSQRVLEKLLGGERLLDLPWRRNVFGMQTLPAGLPLASLLRLDPGERAPTHAHGRRDVAVVLTGAFADHFGVYELGDLVFAEPGMRHAPRAVGGRTCVCLLATEPGKPILGLVGLLESFLPQKARQARR